MYELENFVKFLKEKFTQEELNLALFVCNTDLLRYTEGTEKVKENDKILDKKTNILKLTYLKFCAKNYTDSENILEKMFFEYVDYSLKEYEYSWKLNLNVLDQDIKSKCSYCNVNVGSCPFKLAAYIKKCIDDNHFDSKAVFKLIDDTYYREYNQDEETLNYIINSVLNAVGEDIDIVGSAMLIDAKAVEIIDVEDEILKYRRLDFNVKNNSFFNNIKEFYEEHIGIEEEINLSNVIFRDSDSYIFKKSPFEIAAYIKYLCDANNVNPEVIYQRIDQIRDIKDANYKIAYYNHYVNKVQELDIAQSEKNELINVLTYMRNYYFNDDVPYIHFNIALYTRNLMIADEVVRIINRFSRTFRYIKDRDILWVDTEMIIKKAKDSTDMIYQVERIFNDNDIVVFENMNKMKSLNEYKVEALLTAIEKYSLKNLKSITIFIENEENFKLITQSHPGIEKNIINTRIRIEGYEVSKIKEKVIGRLEGIMKVDDDFSQELEKYIKKTYNYNTVDEYLYIDNIYNQAAFNKFKSLNVSKSFTAIDSPKEDNIKSVEEILEELNSLVGLTDMKDTIRNIIKYINYNKRINGENISNYNMIFKGNAGTGKTTVAKKISELFYALGLVKENKLVEVTSKDLIGSHIGETAPKTQAVIESALDGVLFVDEAYTISANKSGASASYAMECIATMCKAMEVYKDRLVIIFAGYTKEMNDFINSNQGLMSRIGFELEFPDFTKEELMQIFQDEVNKNGFMLEMGVKERVETLVMKNKVGRNFGNARYVINLFSNLVLTHASRCDETDNNLKIITNDDLTSFKETKKDKTRTIDDIMGDLNSLIGLETVKDTLNGFVSLIELDKKLNRELDFNMHMIFKGNAGTGKTTVARLISEIYYNLGYIKRNKLVEVQSQDLIGEFLGQTGPKTQAVIESALDGVLFIDEAYSIMEHNGTNASYSAECVATLLKAMEDYQGRLIIIFAGYTDEMKKFRDLNPGLKSRIGYEITFDDYSIDELMQIFEKKIKDKQFKADDGAREKVRNILLDAMNVENFGNGRFVENMVQKIIIEHAKNTRCDNEYERLVTFNADDVAQIKAEESRKRIGF